jgi:hypothetical protein
MKTQLSIAQQKEKIATFSRLYREGMDAWTSAGKIIVDLVDTDPNVYDKIIATCPMLTASALATFERIGRGLLHAPLAMDGSHGGKRLQSLPLSQQIKYENEPIPLIVHTPDGSTDTLMVRARDMTRDQAKQAFANGRIRTEGEQKAMLIEQRSKSSPIPEGVSSPAWTIKGGKVVFERQVTLTARELGMIISQLK